MDTKETNRLDALIKINGVPFDCPMETGSTPQKRKRKANSLKNRLRKIQKKRSAKR